MISNKLIPRTMDVKNNCITPITIITEVFHFDTGLLINIIPITMFQNIHNKNEPS